MSYRTLLLTCFVAIGLLSGCTVAQSDTNSNMTNASQPGMAHTVYFWLKDGLTQEELSSFETGVQQLENAFTVRRIFVGKPAATPSRGVVDNSFDYSLVLWFDDVAGHDA